MNPAIVPLLQLLVGIFRKRRFIRDAVLPIVDGVGGLTDTAERRRLVLENLKRHGLDENEARLLTEAGVRMWKKREAKRLKKAAKMAARENR